MKLRYTAQEKDKSRTVHSVMRKELEISATMMRRLKKADAISVSGKSVFTNYKLAPREVVEIDIIAAEEPCGNLPEFGEIEVLFENEGLLAINKPPGMLVHPSRSRYTGTLSNFVAGYLEAQGGSFCHAVNRLDRDTSGIVLFAKNSYMKALASTALSAADASKQYFALVSGEMPESGTIAVPIKRFEERNMLRVPSPDGQRAVTHFDTARVFAVDGEMQAGGRVSPLKDGEELPEEFCFSLVKFRLETGRTHQIRVHCLHSGHPILGDKLYCDSKSQFISQALGITVQVLHAGRLSFTDPITKKYIEIKAPWHPKNFPCILKRDMLAYLG